MRRSEAWRWLVGVLLLALSGLAAAQVPVSAALDDTAAPRIGVLTMGPGEIFWERFGHDAIVVEDPASGTRTSYNFGYFDLAEDGFIGRFIRGRMEYMLVALPLEHDLQYYQAVGRGAWLQWLDLEPEQALAMAADLAENAKPENARYRYDYYTDNCATRVRDALDRTLDGGLRRQLHGRSRGDTYRSESLRLASPDPWMWLGFDLGLSPYADRALSRWEQGFLPRRLADDLREVRRADGRPLVVEEIELLPQRLPPEPQARPRAIMQWLFAGLLGAGLVLAVARPRPRLLAGLALPFWLLCAALGLLLALGWAFTDHQAMHANRNLLLLSPLCLLLLPGGWALMRGRSPSPFFRGMLVLVAVLAALACVPLWLQAAPQRNGHWIALLLPLHAALALALGRLRMRPA